jgi:hypothetical protein
VFSLVFSPLVLKNAAKINRASANELWSTLPGACQSNKHTKKIELYLEVK